MLFAKKSKPYEEVNDKLEEILNNLSNENNTRKEKYNREKNKYTRYDPSTDTNEYLPGYKEAGSKYLGDNSEDVLYNQIVVSNKLEQSFTEEAFMEVYDYTRSEYDTFDFHFSEYLVKNMITYNKYLNANEEEKANDFDEYVEIQKQQEKDEERKRQEQELLEMQESFVDKTPEELQEMYEKDKSYIDFKYKLFVSSHGLEDVIPFDEFLKVYDRADRNYNASNMNIDGRIMMDVLNTYYEKFNLEDKITKEEFIAKFTNPVHNGSEYREALVVPEDKLKYNPEEDLFREELEKIGVDADKYQMMSMLDDLEKKDEQKNGPTL